MGLSTPRSYLVIVIVVALLFMVLQMQITHLQRYSHIIEENGRNYLMPGKGVESRQGDSDSEALALENSLADQGGRRLKGSQRVYLDEDAKSSKDDKMIIIYNRVPKTGSTSFMSILYKLHKENNFSVLYVNVSSRSHILSLPDQLLFMQNITSWTERMPSIYHGHLPFVNFRKLGFDGQPIYINVVREPLERLVSYYYFLRYGDRFRPYLKRTRFGDTTTFDECIEKNGRDCQPDKLWLQIPFFCGNFPQCWETGSKWALQQAKRHLVEHYFLVGTTEKLGQFVRLLEVTLPRMFKGATNEFHKGGGIHIRKTKKKYPLLPKTIKKIKNSKVWQLEHEFYLFVMKVFDDTYQRAIAVKNNVTTVLKGQFFYQKIKPDIVRR